MRLRPAAAPPLLEIPAAGVTVLLGARGAGKTRLLRRLAGLDRQVAGQLSVGGEDPARLPASHRDVGFVPTGGVTYPHLTVRDNIASPLHARRSRSVRRAEAALSIDEIDTAVTAIARQLGIDARLDVLPARLSGADRRRVALARAFVRSAALTLLDEPLAGLDAQDRVALEDDLLALIEAAPGAIVHATGDPAEALRVGGHVAVLSAGGVLQRGRTVEVLLRPATLEVARLFGDPVLNPLPAQTQRNALQIDAGPRIALLAPLATPSPAVTVGIRSGDLRLQGLGGDVHIDARVDAVDACGSDGLVFATSRCGPLVARVPWGSRNPASKRLEVGQTVRLYIDPGALFVFAQDGRLLLAPERARLREVVSLASAASLAPAADPAREPATAPAVAASDSGAGSA